MSQSPVSARRNGDSVKLSVEYVNRRREIVSVGIDLTQEEANTLAKRLHMAANP